MGASGPEFLFGKRKSGALEFLSLVQLIAPFEQIAERIQDSDRDLRVGFVETSAETINPVPASALPDVGHRS